MEQIDNMEQVSPRGSEPLWVFISYQLTSFLVMI
jgi:hypothetical protein